MKLAILGCGNMAQALVGPMPLSDWNVETIAYDPIPERASQLGDRSVKDVKELGDCDLYLISCKPQQFEELATQFQGEINSSAIIISIMAGISTKRIKESLGVAKIVRVMPNTPALIGAGVNAIFFGPGVEKEKIELIEKMFHSISEVFIFPKEESIDIITGFTGSGPAYIFEIARILIEKLSSMGVTKTSSSHMIKQTIYGAAKLMMESEQSPLELRDAVTSKEGVTFDALEVFKKNKLENIFSDALDAAYKRSKELSL